MKGGMDVYLMTLESYVGGEGKTFVYAQGDWKVITFRDDRKDLFVFNYVGK
jgi:hypothetical protein